MESFYSLLQNNVLDAQAPALANQRGAAVADCRLDRDDLASAAQTEGAGEVDPLAYEEKLLTQALALAAGGRTPTGHKFLHEPP